MTVVVRQNKTKKITLTKKKNRHERSFTSIVNKGDENSSLNLLFEKRNKNVSLTPNPRFNLSFIIPMNSF